MLRYRGQAEWWRDSWWTGCHPRSIVIVSGGKMPFLGGDSEVFSVEDHDICHLLWQGLAENNTCSMATFAESTLWLPGCSVIEPSNCSVCLILFIIKKLKEKQLRTGRKMFTSHVNMTVPICVSYIRHYNLINWHSGFICLQKMFSSLVSRLYLSEACV